MNLSIVDALIVIFVLLGGIVGYKNGFIREGIHFIGIIIITVISFMLKDILMVFLYENLPFFGFFGIFKGIFAINILFYQLISFLIIFAALAFILKVIIVITGFIEYLVKLTVFLKASSSILGIIVGVLEFYVYVFIILYILNIPIFNLHYVAESKLGNKVLYETPILSNYVNKTIDAYTDIWTIIENKDKNSSKEINTLILASLLDHKLITVDSAKKLVDKNKLEITDPSILNNYTETNDNYFYNYVKERIPIKNK